MIAQEQIASLLESAQDSSQVAELCVSGADAQTFLNNMSTNDFMADHEFALGAFCNPKGRVIANFIARCHSTNDDSASEYRLLLARDLVDSVSEHLLKFRLMSKFEITHNEATGSQDTDKERAWQLDCIRSRHPWVSKATSEKLIPQSINLDLNGAVSFKKGCYPGQEVVARMHYLGKLKKRTYLFCAEATDAFAAGADVYADDDEVACGTVLNSVSDGQQVHTLAVISIKDIDRALRSPQSGELLGTYSKEGIENYASSFDPDAD